MSAYNLNPLYPKPTFSASALVAGRALSITSTATTSFADTFNVSTDMLVLDVQTGNAYCTFDGTTPSSGLAHILYSGSQYTWSKSAAITAKFVATTTANSLIYASEFQT